MKRYVQGKGACFVVGLTAPDPEVERLVEHSETPFLVFKADNRFGPGFHWTPQGHTLAAERIEQFLLTNTVGVRYFPLALSDINNVNARR